MNKLNAAGICVDDDPHILQMLSLQLRKCVEKEPVLLDFFLKPEQVLLHIEELKKKNVPVRFLLTDFRMPGMSGYELIRLVKKTYPEIKCILLSGQADQYLVDELQKEGLLEAFVGKPWKEQELFRLLGCGV